MDRIPILRMGDCLLITIQVDMHDRLALALQDDLTAKIHATGAKGVLIDISALEVVDSFMNCATRWRRSRMQCICCNWPEAMALFRETRAK